MCSFSMMTHGQSVLCYGCRPMQSQHGVQVLLAAVFPVTLAAQSVPTTFQEVDVSSSPWPQASLEVFLPSTASLHCPHQSTLSLCRIVTLGFNSILGMHFLQFLLLILIDQNQHIFLLFNHLGILPCHFCFSSLLLVGVRAAEDSPSAHGGDRDGIPRSQLWSGPVLVLQPFRK